MYKIRLFRIGKKKKAVYRIIAIDSRKKNGYYKDNVGFYNPITKEFKVDFKKVTYLKSYGAQLTKTLSHLIQKNYVK